MMEPVLRSMPVRVRPRVAPVNTRSQRNSGQWDGKFMVSISRSARVVVIGAGIVGNSLVHHLALPGGRDIVQW